MSLPPEIRVEQLHAHAQFVRAVARGILGGDSEVGDVLQDTFLVAWRTGPDEQGAWRPWLRTVARRLSLDRLRSAKRRALHEHAAARPEGLPALGDLAAQEEIRHFVAEAVFALEEPYRTTMLWRYYVGRSAAEIAQLQDVPVATVRTRLHRGVLRLREQLDARHGGDRRAWAAALSPLAHASRGTAAVAIAGGWFLMKKLAVALAVLLLAIGGYALATRRTAEVDDVTGTEAGPPAATRAGAGLLVRDPAAAVAKADKEADPRRPSPVASGPAIRGRVVDGEGRGIARAWVAAFPDNAAKTVRPEEVGEKSQLGATNYTDESGGFAVAAVGRAPYFDVVAEAEGFAPTSTDSVRAGSEVTITLSPARRLTGRVLTMDGEPVGGAHVSVRALVGVVRFEQQVDSAADGRYRVDGLPAAGQSGALQSAVVVTREGFAPLYVEGLGRGRPSDVERTLDLVLIRGATLEGRVVEDESGSPIEGARVVLLSIESMMSWSRAGGVSIESPWSPRVLAETRSGADGTFRIEHVPATGFHRVQTSNSGRRGMTLGHVGAWKQGWAWSTDEVPVAADGASIAAEIRLRPSTALAGRVVDAQKKPIPGARIYCTLDGATRQDSWLPACVGAVPSNSAITGDDGRYRIEAAATSFPHGRVKVTAFAPSRGEAWDGGTVRDLSVTVDAAPGQETTVPDIVVATEAAATGTGKETSVLVVDSAGVPVWGARVEDTTGGVGRVASRTGRTDAEGRIRVGVRAGRDERGPIHAVVRARGFAPAPVALPLEPKADEEIRVVLEPGRNVAGRVLQADRSPAVGAVVTVCNGAVPLAEILPKEGTPMAMATFEAKRPADAALVRYATVVVGPDGAFSAGDLPEGPYHLLAQPTWDSGPRAFLARPTTLSGVASGTSDAEMLLPPFAKREFETVAGSVLDAATGKPVGSFDVSFVRRREPTDPPPTPTTFRSADGSSMLFAPSSSTVTEKTSVGRFESRNLESGTYDVSVSAAGYVSSRIEGLAVGATEVALPPVLLARGNRVHGTARAPEGISFKDRSITFTGTGSGPRASASFPVSGSGAYEGTGLSPGRYRVTVLVAQGWDESAGPPLLREGDEEMTLDSGDAQVDLSLVRAGTLVLQVTDKRLAVPQGWMAEPTTPAQKEFGKGSKLSLKTADGRVVFAQDSLENGIRIDLMWNTLLPGAYVARLEMPGGEVAERRVEVTAGARVDVTLGGSPQPGRR